jgi:hypothetical protein
MISMLLRALCLVTALYAGSVSPWVAAPCCAAEPDCCPDCSESGAPECPLLPRGDCSCTATMRLLGTSVRGHEASPASLLSTAALTGPVLPQAFRDPRERSAPSAPSFFLLTRSLRN